MKKKIWLVLTEMIAAIGLTCACSGEQKAEEPQESERSVPIETDAEKQSGDAADLTPAPDLNHNGIAEEVRLTDMDDGMGRRLEIWEDRELIDVENGYFAHTGWTSVFLCTLDGEDYLLRYHPTMFQGVCAYYYTLSTFTDNKETVIQQNMVDFDINFGAPVHNDFDAEEIAAFMGGNQ
ncbi:MAG: hypothetical protein K2N95_01935 [Lachnospiraceae bacterium]|nr:hypothetical protein [Lachnospiraceae bacterium]